MELIKYFNMQVKEKFNFEATETTLKIRQLKLRIELAQTSDADLIDEIKALNLNLEKLKVEQVLNPSEENQNKMKTLTTEITALNERLQSKRESAEVIPVLEQAIEKLQNIERKEYCELIIEKFKEIQNDLNNKIDKIIERMKDYNDAVYDLMTKEYEMFNYVEGAMTASRTSMSAFLSNPVGVFSLKENLGFDAKEMNERKKIVDNYISMLFEVAENDDYIVLSINDAFKIIHRDKYAKLSIQG